VLTEECTGSVFSSEITNWECWPSSVKGKAKQPTSVLVRLLAGSPVS